jgi:AmiR/NasT family two-component response regulator
MAHRVMLVEDEGIVAMDIQHRLEKLKYQIVGHAVSGDEAVRLANETLPDLILMDVKLRGPIDGIEAAALIHSTLDVPIIYLTAFADETTLERARLTQAYGYLIKPFEDHELKSAILSALDSYFRERNLRVDQ